METSAHFAIPLKSGTIGAVHREKQGKTREPGKNMEPGKNTIKKKFIKKKKKRVQRIYVRRFLDTFSERRVIHYTSGGVINYTSGRAGQGN